MASTYDITMKQYNGTDYDTLYPTADLANNVSGVLPLANGGTGETSLDNLLSTLIGNGLTEKYTGSYVGTGTHGSANPNSITVGWASGTPRCLIVAGGGDLMIWLLSSSTAPTFHGVSGGSPGFVANVSYSGATVSWYNASQAYAQMNTSGTTYFWFALR